jgi:ATP-dependent RNA helicase DDX31/DBP7
LTSAAELCRGISQEGEAKASGNTFSDGRGEAFTFAIQNRLEECVIQNDTEYKASIDKKFKGDPKQRRKQKKEAVGPLLEGARKAFSAFVRAYPAKEKAVRHIFNARALHLGHIARSLALKETPKMVSKVNNSKNSHSIEAGGKSNKARKGGEKRKSRLTFGERQGAEMEGDEVDDEDDAAEQERNLSLLSSAIGKEDSIAAHASKKFKSSSSGGTGGGNVQKRMMEAAMRMQAQEFM